MRVRELIMELIEMPMDAIVYVNKGVGPVESLTARAMPHADYVILSSQKTPDEAKADG